MNHDSRADELIQKYLDGVLSAVEVNELQELLVSDTTAADAFVVAAREDEQYRSHFRQQRHTARMKAILDNVMSAQEGRRNHQRSHESNAANPRRLRLKPWHWSVAASLLLAVGVVSYLTIFGYDRSPPDLPHEVIAGSVRVNGVATTRIANEATIEVVGRVAAVIQLADGSRAELASDSSATIRGQVGDVRQVVALYRGSGRFVVEKGDSQFRVETPVGGVTALGTEFTVQLLSNDTNSETGGADGKAALVVGVIAGHVEVDYADETFPLALGDDRIFASALVPPSTPPDLVGNVVAVADDLRSIHIEIKKTRENPHRHTAIHIGDDTELSWVNVPVNHRVPGLGYRASVWLHEKRGDENAAAVRFSVEKGSGPPPNLTGRVIDVADDGRSITLQLPRYSKSKSPPTTRRVQLDQHTDAEYFFVRYDGEQPTVGYNATVWLRPNASTVAQTVRFSGDKRGDYSPDLTGRVVAVADRGRVIEIEHPKSESVFHPGLKVTRTTLTVGRRGKLLYRDLPPAQRHPVVGYYAEVWLERDSTDHVEAIRFRPGQPRQHEKTHKEHNDPKKD